MILQFMQEYPFDVGCIPDLVTQLRSKGTNGSFAVLMFRPPEAMHLDNSENDANIQYSMNNNVVGLDWVLMAPINIKDRERITEFFISHGHTVATESMNAATYLRVEDGDLTNLGIQVLTEFYKINSDTNVGLLVNNVELDLSVLGPAIQKSTGCHDLPDSLQYLYSLFMAKYHQAMAEYHGWMAKAKSVLSEMERDDFRQTCSEMEAVLDELFSIARTFADHGDTYIYCVNQLNECNVRIAENLNFLQAQYKEQLFH